MDDLKAKHTEFHRLGYGIRVTKLPLGNSYLITCPDGDWIVPSVTDGLPLKVESRSVDSREYGWLVPGDPRTCEEVCRVLLEKEEVVNKLIAVSLFQKIKEWY